MNDRRPVFERKQAKPVTLADMPAEVSAVVAYLASDETQMHVLLSDQPGFWAYPNGNQIMEYRLFHVKYILEPELKQVEQPESQVGKTLAEATPGFYLVESTSPIEQKRPPAMAIKPLGGDVMLAFAEDDGNTQIYTSSNLTLGRILAEYDPPRWDTEGGAE